MTYNAFEQYKQNTVFTATPEELTLMLYDGAIKFINKGKIAIQAGETQKAHEAIIRAQDIIIELLSSLDMKYEISKNLKDIYDFMMSRLIDANISKNSEPLDEVLGLMTELRDTWKEAIKEVKKSRYHK